jgi:hypothetical protein
VFTFGELPFEVTQAEDMDENHDDLMLRFHFVNPLPPGNTRPLTDLIEDWKDQVPSPYTPAYFEAFRFKKGRQVSRWCFLDTGGNIPELSPFLEDLFLRIHNYAPLELVEISDAEHY